MGTTGAYGPLQTPWRLKWDQNQDQEQGQDRCSSSGRLLPTVFPPCSKVPLQTPPLSTGPLCSRVQCLQQEQTPGTSHPAVSCLERPREPRPP